MHTSFKIGFEKIAVHASTIRKALNKVKERLAKPGIEFKERLKLEAKADYFSGKLKPKAVKGMDAYKRNHGTPRSAEEKQIHSDIITGKLKPAPNRAPALALGDKARKSYIKKTASGSKLYHAAELLGLGALAIPSIYKMTTGKDIGEGKYHGLELGGLGVLAAPSILAMAGGRKGLKGLNPFKNKRVAELANIKKHLNSLHATSILA